jgi:hypothetical protein
MGSAQTRRCSCHDLYRAVQFGVNYRITANDEQWRVQQVKFDQLNRWHLYVVRNERWKALKYFTSADEAMQAVAGGQTGVVSWDSTPHDPSDFVKEKWVEGE